MDFVISNAGELKALNGAYCWNGIDAWKGMQLGGWRLQKSDERWVISNQSRTVAVRSSIEEGIGIPESVTSWEQYDNSRHLWTSVTLRIQQIEKCVQISNSVTSPFTTTYQQNGFYHGMPKYSSISNDCILYYSKAGCWAVALHSETGPDCKVREMGLLKSDDTSEIPTSQSVRWQLPNLQSRRWESTNTVKVLFLDAGIGSSASLWEQLQKMSEQIQSMQRQQNDVMWLHSPEGLSVSVPSMPSISGLYSVEKGLDGEHESRNRLPVWQSNTNALYCTETGRWAITTNKYSERDRAVLIAREFHNGRTAYEKHSWVDINGVEVETFISISDTTNTPPWDSSLQVPDRDYGTQLPIVMWSANSEQARCRLHIFSEQHLGSSSNIPDTETLITGILNQSVDLDDIMIQLCNEHKISPHAWTGVDSAAVAEYVLKALVAKADLQNVYISRSEITTAVDRILAGTTTLKDVVRDLCIRHGVAVDPWIGDFPSGIRLPSFNGMNSSVLNVGAGGGGILPAADELADFMTSELGMSPQEALNHICSPQQPKGFPVSLGGHHSHTQPRSTSPPRMPTISNNGTPFMRSPVPMSRFISPSQ
eukprot:TRINITY_DN8794_c5_g1_i1.p1 TRINITY_DN8794_c5_g1~~TRINITY_DN8794_c5_g1_i1.p1  ORF type:complete len:594 (+),score=122.86 TRINITY_DN8794_c5_g1_i1:83-1864(+)